MAAVLALVVGLGTVAACANGSPGTVRAAGDAAGEDPADHLRPVGQASEHAGHRDRRHALGRAQVHAQRAQADRGPRPDLRELVRAVPAVLPEPRLVPHRQVRPQPPRAQPRRPVRVPGLRRPDDARDRAPGRRATRRRWSASTSTATARQHVHGSTEPSLHYVPPGWDQWMAGTDHLLAAGDPHHGGGTYNYFSMTQNVNGQVVLPRAIYSTRRARGAGAAACRRLLERSPTPWFVWWTPSPRTTGSPHEPDDPAPALRGDGEFGKWATPARPRLGQGPLRRPGDHPRSGVPPVGLGRGRHQRQAALPAQAARAHLEEKAARDRGDAAARRVAVRARRADRAAPRAAPDAAAATTNTVIVFTSDNGYYLGEHRKRTGKIIAARAVAAGAVPDRRARACQHGRRYDPITTIDLAPTLADVRRPDGMPGADGISLAAHDREGRPGLEPRRSSPRAGWATAPTCGTPRGSGSTPPERRAACALARWKYVRYSTGEVELYDLKNDPLELQSSAGRPGVRPGPAQAREDLGAVLRLQGRRVRRAAAAGVPRDGRADQGDHGQRVPADPRLLRRLSAALTSGRGRGELTRAGWRSTPAPAPAAARAAPDSCVSLQQVEHARRRALQRDRRRPPVASSGPVNSAAVTSPEPFAFIGSSGVCTIQAPSPCTASISIVPVGGVGAQHAGDQHRRRAHRPGRVDRRRASPRGCAGSVPVR